MKKNTFKPSDFKYEPRRQQKQPLWMHSIQTYHTSKTTLMDAVVIVLIVVAIAIVWSVLA